MRSAAQARAEKNWRLRKVKAGLCNRCGKKPRRKGMKECGKCRSRQKAKSETRRVTLADLKAATEYLGTLQDEGPPHEGWQSDRLSKLCARLEAICET